MKGNKTALAAYGLLLLCMVFALGYLLGLDKGETELHVTVEPTQIVQVEADGQASSEELQESPALDGPIDLNTATGAELEQLPGIGPMLAERIIAYRQQHGRFVSKEQIMDVEGIGEKRFEELKDLITIGGAP